MSSFQPGNIANTDPILGGTFIRNFINPSLKFNKLQLGTRNVN